MFNNFFSNVLLTTPENMSNASSVVIDDMWLLSYPGQDTAFAYFFKTQSWSMFDGFTLKQGTWYDTSTTGKYPGGEILVFVRQGENGIYSYDSDYYFNKSISGNYTAVWEKSHLSVSRLRQVIESFYVYKTFPTP